MPKSRFKINSKQNVGVTKKTDETGVKFEDAREKLEESAKKIFLDPRVRSLGIGKFGARYGYRAVRNSRLITPESTLLREASPENLGIPITYIDTPHEVERQIQVPFSGPGAPTVGSHVAEQDRYRPLFSGLQIQNYDNDVRTGVINQGIIVVGTLGCFVRLADGSPAILSNNHVLGGENRGVKGVDRIQQPGNGAFIPDDMIGVLTDFIALQPSPPNASVPAGNVVFNEVDAAVATIQSGVIFGQGFNPNRSLISPAAIVPAKVGDKVFKVGRTTGLTYGEIVDIATIVGPVPYNPGPCWFQASMTVEGDNGTMFSDKGDSGSIIVRTSGEIVGLLYAGNGVQSYGCSIDLAFQALQCALY